MSLSPFKCALFPVPILPMIAFTCALFPVAILPMITISKYLVSFPAISNQLKVALMLSEGK